MSKLLLNVRELFDEFFFQKLFFQFSMEFERRFFLLCRKLSTESSEMHFTCPEEHFDKNNLLTLWNNFRIWAMKCLICGGKFAALLANLLFCLQMGNWKNSFERIFTFFWFFWTLSEHFLVVAMYHSRHGGPNWIPLAKTNISIKKNFTRKLFVLSGLCAQFFEHSMKSFRHVVKTTIYLFTGALWERLFFRIFQNCFRTLSYNRRPDLWRKVSAALPKLHSTCPKNFSFFLQTFVMFHLTS